MIRKCSLCQSEVLEFGYVQLQDGIICKDCVKKNSSWLSEKDYQMMTIEDIKNHLEYRNNNTQLINDFRCTDLVEGKYFLYIDTSKRLFIFSKRLNPIEENADVFKLDDIQDIQTKEEIYQDNKGVDLFLEVTLNQGNIQFIRFRLNEFGCIEKDSQEYNDSIQLANLYKEHLLNPIEGKEIDMANKTGRKKHVVEGTVKEIKKADSGLNMNSVGSKRSILNIIASLFGKK